MKMPRQFPAVAAALVLAIEAAAQEREPVAAGFPAVVSQSEARSLDFAVFWPPRDPGATPPPETRPLLKGTLTSRLERLPDNGFVLRLRASLTRPSDEAGREFWNSRLAFPEFDWMRYVRVWDADKQWLWPNLPYLLRLHGTERVERYGGVDPAKGVDNDFAAVLIRKYDVSGQEEHKDTQRAPLVAAEWYPAGVAGGDKQTIVHTAQSDEFALHLGRAQGVARIWLIYADFMGAKPPQNWPKAQEFAGGILACFEAHWELNATPADAIRIRAIAPKQGTGFDWERWARRTRASQRPSTTARLSDRALESSP